MAGITLSGVGSGLDVESLVTQLVAAEGAPTEQRLNRREATLQARISGMGQFKNLLSGLRDAAKNLSVEDKVNVFKTAVSQEGFLSVTASGDAQPASYDIVVDTLARAQKLATPADQTFASLDDVMGEGEITFRFGSYDDTGAFTADADREAVSVTIGPDNNTLAGVREAINDANLGVTANIINDGNGYRLVLSSEKTGVNNAMEISVNDGGVLGIGGSGLGVLNYNAGNKSMLQTAAAQDARLTIDGLAVTSASNRLTNTIQGVTIDLEKADPDTPLTLAIERDLEATMETVQGFVNAYNALLKQTAALRSYDADSGRRGPLLGESSVRSSLSQIRRSLVDQVEGLGEGPNTLSQIGIRLNRDGELSVDKSLLEAAINDDPKAVLAVFSGPATANPDPDAPPAGIAARLDEYIDSLLKSDGAISRRTETLNNQLRDVEDDRLNLEERLLRLEERYRREFAALDQIMGQFSATGAYLNQTLASLPGFTQQPQQQ